MHLSPDIVMYLLRNLYVSQEATEPDMENGVVQIRKGVCQGCIVTPCLLICM